MKWSKYLLQRMKLTQDSQKRNSRREIGEYLEQYVDKIRGWDGKEDLVCVFYEDEWEYNGITLTSIEDEGTVQYMVRVFASKGDVAERGNMYSAYILDCDSLEVLKENLMTEKTCKEIKGIIDSLMERIDKA